MTKVDDDWIPEFEFDFLSNLWYFIAVKKKIFPSGTEWILDQQILLQNLIYNKIKNSKPPRLDKIIKEIKIWKEMVLGDMKFNSRNSLQKCIFFSQN